MEYFFKHLGFTLDTTKRMKSFYLLVILILRKQSLACLNFKVILILRTFEKDKICFKNPENPRRIDLFITNSSVFKTQQLVNGLSDVQKMIVTLCKESVYRKYKNFEVNTFKN